MCMQIKRKGEICAKTYPMTHCSTNSHQVQRSHVIDAEQLKFYKQETYKDDTVSSIGNQ